MFDNFKRDDFYTIIETCHLAFVAVYAVPDVFGICISFFFVPHPYTFVAVLNAMLAAAAAFGVDNMLNAELLSFADKFHTALLSDKRFIFLSWH